MASHDWPSIPALSGPLERSAGAPVRRTVFAGSGWVPGRGSGRRAATSTGGTPARHAFAPGTAIGRGRLPRVEPLGARSGARSAAAVAAALAAIVAVGLAGRLSGGGADARPAATVSSPRDAGVQAGAAWEATSAGTPVPGAGEAILTMPRPDVLWFGTAVMPVSGVAGAGLEAVRVVVTVGATSIGTVTLPVLEGRFGGTVAIVPPETRSAGLLEVFAVGADRTSLARVRFPIESGRVVLLTSPEAADPALSAPLEVAGITYKAVPQVRIVLTGSSGVLAETTVMPRPVHGAARRSGAVTSFAARLDVPATTAAGPARLHVMAIRPAGGAEVGHADLTLVLATRARPD